MPTTLTISLADGSTWTLVSDSLTQLAVQPAPLTSAAPVSAMVDLSPTASDVSTPTQADVQAALAKVPPRFRDAAASFVRSIVAAGTMVYVVLYQGDIGKVIHDPVGFGIALGTACLTAGWHFLRWGKDA